MNNIINTSVEINAAGTYIYEMDSFQDEAGGRLHLLGNGNVDIRIYGGSGALYIFSEKTSGTVTIDIYGFMGNMSFYMDANGTRSLSLIGCIGDVVNSGKITFFTAYSSLFRIVGTAPDAVYEESTLKNIYTPLVTAGAITTKVSNGTGTGQLSLSSGKVRALIYAGDVDNDAITAATIKADAVTKIQNGLATEANVDDVKSKVDDLQSDIDGIETALIDIDTQLDDVNIKLDDIQGVGFDSSTNSLVVQSGKLDDVVNEVNGNEDLLMSIRNKSGTPTFNQDIHSLVAQRERIDQVLVATGTPIGYAPDVATRTIGSDEGGTVSDLAAHDDSSMVTGENATTGLEVDVIRATSVVTEVPAVLRITGYYDGSLTHQLDVSIYNYITSAYDQVGIMIDRSAAFDYSFPLSSGNHNLSTGEMKFKIKHAVSSYFASHKLYLDFVGWEKVESNGAILSDLAAIRAKTDQTNFSMGSILAKNESGNKIAEDSTVAKSAGTKGTDSIHDDLVNLDAYTQGMGGVIDTLVTSVGNLMTKTSLVTNLKLIMNWLRRKYKDDIIE